MHTEPSPLAGKTVRIKQSLTHPQQKNFGGEEYRVEDWWDRINGKSWGDCDGNPACIIYALRSGVIPNSPDDDEVLYGKIGPFGHLVHVTEIEQE